MTTARTDGGRALGEDFRLAIDLTEREISIDAHTNTFEVLIDGSHVEYHGPYGGGTRGRHDTDRVEFTLSDDQRTRLRRELDAFDLRQSVDETFEVDTADEFHRRIDVEATLHVDGQTHELQVEGVTKIRGRETDMEHYEQARALETVCWLCKGWAENRRRWWNPLGFLRFLLA